MINERGKEKRREKEIELRQVEGFQGEEEEQSWPGHGTVAVCTIYQIFN